MRRMKKHRLLGIIISVLLCLNNCTKAQENFEDADKLSELMSGNSGQQFDLRHTIPGIPDVDYPIYSEVPKTSFECAGKHEGYYADIESRCQAFRICTHTARSVSGFGFLCPNGTLFSQKYFVCDWYRNVDCDDSERFYNKNDANRIGSSLDMMETVRQMMEYPMKTISKALQQNPGSSRKPTQRHRGGNKASNQQTTLTSDNANVDNQRKQNSGNTARKSVTRAQVESAHSSRGTKKFHKQQTEEAATNESSRVIEVNEESEDGRNSGEVESATSVDNASSSDIDEADVYVNSLGELSTDPGVHFDRTNAHIIAEPRRYRYEKNMNFAAKVNAALNDLTDVADGAADEKLAPDYVKQMRSTSKTETNTNIDLASNINGLLDEVANDLNPSQSGYHVQAPNKSKHSFRFLSRGFSSQDDPYKYNKPKQTASTIRFTPNQLPLDNEKQAKKPGFEIADDAAGFGQSPTITTTTLEPPLLGGALDYLKPPLESPAFEEISYLEPPLLPPIDSDETKQAIDETTEAELSNIITTTPDTEVYTVTPSALDLPTYAALADTTTSTPQDLETTTVADIKQNLVSAEQQSLGQNVNDEAPIDEDRLDVNKQAESLFLSGLKLTANENETKATTPQTPLLIRVAEDHSYLTAWITSTGAPTTVNTESSFITGSTEAATAAIETNSLQARIRNYRRLTSLQRATAKPVIYGKRGHMRMSGKSNTSTATTTPKPKTTTRSYLKRVAASRLRLSRLSAAASGSNNRNNNNNLSNTSDGSLSPVDNAIDGGDNKKLSIRNIDKETAVAGNGLNDAAAAKAQGIVTWESVRNSLQRFQVGHKKPSDEKPNELTTTPTATIEATTTARNPLTRTRNRFSNLKMPTNLRQKENINSQAKPVILTSVAQTVSSSSSSSKSSLPLSFLSSQHTSQAIENLNKAQDAINSNQATFAVNTNLNSNSATSDNSPTFIAFDKLTRSIVDDSILQNYRAGQTLGRSSINPVTNSNAFSARSPTSPIALNNYQSSSRSAFNNQAFPAATARQSHPKITPPAPAPLTPPQRPAHLPIYQPQAAQAPRIVIARAEGQRIEPNSVSSIITSLITQQQQKPAAKPTPATSYVPLDDFLTKKFGNQAPTKATQIAATYYHQPQQLSQQQTRPSISQQYQQQQTRPSIAQQYQPQQPQSQSSNQYRQQSSYMNSLTSLPPPSPQPTSPTIFSNQIQQQQPQQLQFVQQANGQLAAATPSLQPLITQNIFANYQQQQQQLPQFPPLSQSSSSSSQTFQNLPSNLNGSNNFLNIQLPTLANGLIPAPTVQAAQKRSDVIVDHFDLSAYTPLRSVYNGASSYDVPLSSVGRLPNDIQALLRRLRRY